MPDGRPATRPDNRPSPEALLEAARREEGRAGRLKIFVGAAPGVGKTYEMLQQARAPSARTAYDVVVGVVETHGRKETEALLEGLEVIPRKPHRLSRRSRSRRWTSTPILARRPQLVLVDELAHTNAPGSRHPKRYLDVEELLSRRHRRLHHRQHPAHREPERRRRADHARARARDRARLGPRPRRRRRAGRPHARRPDPAPEGRQGLRPQAGRAGARALLLAGQPDGAARAGAAPHGRAGRRAAARRRCRRAPSRARGRRASASWSASARIRARRPRALRQAPGRPPARALDRALRRDAGAACSSTEERARPHRRHAAARRDARRRGGHAFPAATAASPTTSSAYAQANNVTQIVIGKSTRSRWFEILHGSVVHDLVRRAGNISVHVIAGDELVEPSRFRSKTVRTAEAPSALDPRPYLVALLAAVALALGIGMLDPALARHRERRPRLPDRDRRASRCASGSGRRCSPASRRRSATTSSSCRRSTPSPSPIRPTSPPSCFFIVVAVVVSNLAARVRTQAVTAHGARARRPSRSMPSAASSPASARSTTCCGPPPTRSR